MKHTRISTDPAVMDGKPCIKGTCTPVEQLLQELYGGMASAEVLKAHPNLSPEDIQAALDYADDLANEIWHKIRSIHGDTIITDDGMTIRFL